MPMFINRSGKILGPLTDEAFQKSLDSGRVLPTDQVSANKDGPWNPASDLLPQKAVAKPTITQNRPNAPAGVPSVTPESKRGDDLFAGQNFGVTRAFRDTNQSNYAGFSFVEDDGSDAIVVNPGAADKNMHYLDAALSEEMEAERNDEEQSQKNRTKFTLLAITAPIFTIILIVLPFVIYNASRPIRLRMAADSALNRMLLQAVKAEALSNAGKTSEANFAIGQVQAAAVELESALSRMTDEQRAAWEEEKFEDLLKTRFR